MRHAKRITHFWYEGRNVLFGSRRAEKIGIWGRKEATKRARRAARKPKLFIAATSGMADAVNADSAGRRFAVVEVAQ